MTLKRCLSVLIFTVAVALAPLSAQALGLDEAKQRGLVGEMATGYLGAVKGETADVAALIRSINAKRRSEYEKIAQRRDVSVTDVEALAGRKAIDKTPAGQFVNTGGGWQRK